MTVRTRRPERVGIRARLGGLVSTEERQQTTITVLFIGVIVLVALIFIGAIGAGWYNDNVRAVGKVGNVELSPTLLRDSTRLAQYRINRDESRLTQAQVAGQLTADEAQTKDQALQQASSDLSTNALESLVDEVYQSQLAANNGITVSDADINTRYEQEISDAETRHVYVVSIAPSAADPTNGPTTAERQAALDKATQALSDLNAGKDFATVAQTYGTDDKSRAGGDYGEIPQVAIVDGPLATQLWQLPANGTTGVVRGDDGTYRVGRVTDITPGAESTQLKNQLLGQVSEQDVKTLLGYQIAAEGLQNKIVNDALAQTPEQVKLATIYIEGLDTGSTDTADGEVDYYEIVFAPNDSEDNAANVDASDPAWATAKSQADATFATLNAITDVTQRMTQFETTATSTSDDPTSQDSGHVTYTTKDVVPPEIADALWTGTHNKGDLLGPIKSDNGYYVLMFNDKRGSPDDRIKQVQDALAQPGADFNALAKQYSDGPEKDQGGEIGWFTKDSLTSDIADTIFGLPVGGVSDPLELGQGHYFIKVEDKQNRPLDADQQATARSTAFSTWYDPMKQQAITDGTINTIVPLGSAGTDLTGGDQPTP